MGLLVPAEVLVPGFHPLKAGEDWLLAKKHVGKAALSLTLLSLRSCLSRDKNTHLGVFKGFNKNLG